MDLLTKSQNTILTDKLLWDFEHIRVDQWVVLGIDEHDGNGNILKVIHRAIIAVQFLHIPETRNPPEIKP